MQDSRCAVREFWTTMSFFPSSTETFASRYWLIVLAVPYLFLLAWGYWLVQSFPGRFSTLTIVRDPYVSSLGVALLLSAIPFTFWQKTMRNTFSRAVDSGIIEDSQASIEEFLAVSYRFKALLHSPWRYLAIGVFVLSTIWANLNNIREMPGLVRASIPAALFPCLALLSFVAFSYAVGAVAWCLVGSARWIALLSRKKCLRIQPGHSDGCCGLKPIGSCCLKSAVPLLIGIVLCFVWSNSRHVPFFRNYHEGWLKVIVPFSYVMMAVLFALACALVFLPVRGLHVRMNAYKSAQDAQFTRALERELEQISDALASNDQNHQKLLSDRMQLVQTLDPIALRLSTWPFDRASLVKYGIAPMISLAASFGKEAVKSLWQTLGGVSGTDFGGPLIR